MPSLAIPKGSTVLTTRANSLLGSHIAKQFLKYSYKLSGTFNKSYREGKFKLVKVSNMTAKGAFNKAAKGVNTVVHVASILTLNPNPNNIIPSAIIGAINALQSVFAAPSVKRFVFTSSSSTIKSADNAPDAEHRAERPDLIINTMLPNFNFSGSINPVNQGFPNSSSIPITLYNREVTQVFHYLNKQHYIHTNNSIRLHVAAATFKNVKDQQIFSFTEKTFPDNFSSKLSEKTIAPSGKAEDLFRKLGRPGWTSLEDSIVKSIKDLQSASDKAKIYLYN
ncbi:hypothetical protein CSAL01_11232 [Colletotrichum salicis]|uniref:NAD-dependent epimerase/dehydratase domain-containing protein n=1 Tax=Colletotrichum salicis TaxID=1209931 RepID=A0A135UWX5_9PEZI|nr:hypothetical protein CSAL01_11232 [Colletotrichum salicis]